MAKVAVIAGSKSDEKIVQDVSEMLKEFGVEHEIQYLSSHRNRKKLESYIINSDADIFIAIAGLSAHLAGTIASMTIKPVIGVPLSVKLNGLDALFATVQLPTGVPVACVGIDNGKNASLLAIEILALKDEKLRDKLIDYRKGWEECY
ncbi:MAG: 5-(carboxyamino)imidazole ribonucleotide mutase [Nitrososphaerales archaeon]